MRVDAYSRINSIFGVNGKTKTASVSKSGARDKVEISGLGRDMQIAKQAVSESSDIREERVAEVKEQIDKGTYGVSGDAFAEKIIAKYEGFLR